VEKHGLHLPLGTDNIHCTHIAIEASKLETVCVFPTFYFGDVPGGPAMPAGSISIPVKLEMEMLETLCDQIGRNGFEKIILFNGHGGNNPWLQNFVRAVKSKKRDYEVFLYYGGLTKPDKILAAIAEQGRESFPALTDEDIAVLEDWVNNGGFDGHGGFGESAMVMGCYPELVRLDRCEAESGLSRHISDPLSEAGLKWGRAWHVNFPNAYAGTPPTGLNQRIADVTVQLSAEKLAKALKLLKDDQTMDRIISAAYHD
jgi:creatinine amidohydrolase